VNTPPVANAGPNLVFCAIKGYAFDGSMSSDADGDTLGYSWNFGDGSTGSGAKVTHAYAKKGDYKVTLTVDDGSGTNCSMSQDTFTAHVYEKPVPIIKVK